MNFLKRAGAILMVVAIFASSCNKYADDFEQLNKKLDALATQVAGVPQLSTDMAALKSQVTALQTAVAALPTTASITALQTSLNAVDAKVTTVSNNLNALALIAATKSDVAASTAALTTLINKVTTDLTAVINTQIGGLTTLVNSNQAALIARLNTIDSNAAANLMATTDAITALGIQIASDLAMTNGKIDAQTETQLAQYMALVQKADDAALAASNQDTVIAGIVTSTDQTMTDVATALQNTVDILTALAATPTPDTIGMLVSAMQIQIDAMEITLNQVLANTSMYTGAVSLFTDADVDFFMLKIAQMSVINGNLTVNPTMITKMVDLNVILKKVTSVVGGGAVTIWANKDAAKALDLSSLTSVSGTLAVNGGNLITQSSVNISMLSSVSGAVTYGLDGPISLPALSSVGGSLTLTPYTTTGTTVTGTTSVNLPMAMVAGGIAPAGLTLPSATSIVMPANGLTALLAVKATSVSIVNSATLAALTITPEPTATLNFPNTTKSAALTIADGAVVNMPLLAEITGALNITSTGITSVNFDLLKKGAFAITIPGATTVSLPVWTGGGALTAAAATTVSMPANDWSVAMTTSTVVKNLTVGGVKNPVNLAPFTALEMVSISGATVTTWATFLATVTTTAANSALKTVTLGGMIKNADLTGLTALTSLTTSEVVNSLTVVGATSTSLTAVTLGHTAFTSLVDGTPGAILVFTGNTSVKSLTASALDKVVGLSVTGNSALYTLSLPACVSLANNGVGTTLTVNITGNAIRGSFTPAIAAVPLVNPYAEAVITCSTLKALQTWLTLATGASGYPGWTMNMEYNNNPATPYAVAAPTLWALMNANAVSVAIDQATTPASVIDVVTELGIIQ